jgi:hypothetical protein
MPATDVAHAYAQTIEGKQSGAVVSPKFTS